MTARRTLLYLLERGVLIRKPHGRLVINHKRTRAGERLRLVCLAPAFNSTGLDAWRFVVERAARKMGASMRLEDYVHWDDPVIVQSLSNFDGVFLVPSSETIPEGVMERLAQSKRLVVLDGDLSEWGVPSIHMLPPIFIDHLGDHLYKLGHRHIDCLNVQPRDRVINKRIERWLLWREMHKVQGRLIDAPVQPYAHATPQAYTAIKNLLDAREFHASALVCMTGAAATGAIRALHEHGLQVGRDVSVCAVEGGFLARYQMPSYTVLETPDPTSYVEVCIGWLARKTRWAGPLLIEPSKLSLFAGESTGPCPSSPA